MKCKKCNWNERLGCLSPCLSDKNEKKNKVTWQLGLLKPCRGSVISSIAKAIVTLHKQHPTMKQIGSLSSHRYINSPLPRHKPHLIAVQHLTISSTASHYYSAITQQPARNSPEVVSLGKHYCTKHRPFFESFSNLLQLHRLHQRARLTLHNTTDRRPWVTMLIDLIES